MSKTESPPELPSRVYFQCSMPMPVDCKLSSRNLEKIQSALMDVAAGFGFDKGAIWASYGRLPDTPRSQSLQRAAIALRHFLLELQAEPAAAIDTVELCGVLTITTKAPREGAKGVTAPRMYWAADCNLTDAQIQSLVDEVFSDISAQLCPVVKPVQ